MANNKLAAIFKAAQETLEKNKHPILIGVGIATSFSAVVLAVGATVKATKIVEEKRREKGEDLTKGEVFKACWKYYIPAASTLLVSTACLIGANSVYANRTAALATAYNLSQAALTEYKDQVVASVGEAQSQVIRDKVAEKMVEKEPSSETTTKKDVVIMGDGETRCFDTISGRSFRSDRIRIEQAVNDLNRYILSNEYASLNDLYDELGLDHIGIGYDLGWKIDDGRIEVTFGSCVDSNGYPCLTMEFNVPPRYGFDRCV